MRSLLFVPGTRPERFQKALAAGADAVIIDLEDAVEPEHKASARAHILEFAQRQSCATPFMVRVNAADTAWFDDDVALCRQLERVGTIVLPKAESAQHITRVAKAGKPVLPIIESARGVLALPEIAASEQVCGLSLGSLDLMLELGTTADTPGAQTLLDHVRCQILLHSAAHSLASPLDGVYPDFADEQGLRQHAQRMQQMGFSGMLCIHPRQIEPIHQAFVPTLAEQEWAARVLDIATRTGSSAFQLDGKMVDAPVILRARQILGQASP